MVPLPNLVCKSSPPSLLESVYWSDTLDSAWSHFPDVNRAFYHPRIDDLISQSINQSINLFTSH